MWVVCSALATVLLLLGPASATFDLYIDAKDFHKLLGVNSELWYVRDGEVKENALDYVVLVPPNVSVLTFHWRARHNILLPYKAQMHVANPEAALATLSINATGSVPTSTRTFSLTLNCTNRLTTQVDVTLNLQVPLRASLHHLTNITIHRRKLCFRDPSLDEEEESVGVSMVSVRGASAVVYAAVGCLALFLLAVAGLAACTHRSHAAKLRRRRLRCGEAASDQLHSSSTTPCLPNNTPQQQVGLLPPHHQQGSLLQAYNARPQHPSSQHSYVAASSSTSSKRGAAPPVLGWAFGGQMAPTDCGARSTPLVGAQHVPYCVARQGDAHQQQLARVAVEDGEVEVLETIMEGTFGRLLSGVYNSPSCQPTPLQVTVKTVSNSSNASQREVLLQEAVMMVGLQHDHLLPCLAVLRGGRDDAPPLVLYRTTQHGNMKRFLQGCGPLVTREVVSMALQLLHALSFLHAARLLHCDVATRNCLVDTNLRVLLCDCALSRDLFPGDYHCLGDNNNRPVKWLAVEALQHNTFSPQSDVWSWGVLLWEIMTLGQQPYAEIDPFEMEDTLLRGVRLAQPINCPDQLFQAMTYCWTLSPSERPTVADLLVYVTNFMQELDKFV